MEEKSQTTKTGGLVGRVLGRRFLIEARLGGGGMGEVWRARDSQLRCACAVKTLRPALCEDAVLRKRFVQEAVAAAAIRSRHVVEFIAADIDTETTPTVPFLAMELLEGQDLESRIEEQGPLDPPEAIRVLGQVGKALDQAHALGLVHRDVKPANIFLALEDEEIVAKVLDFGVAKFVTESQSGRLTEAGTTLGSPLYMAPEQFQDTGAVDHHADLWSLALVAFKMLSGVELWSPGDLPRLVHQICYGAIPSASERSEGRIPKSAEPWFERALVRKPSARHPSAAALVESLARCLGVPVPSKGQVISLQAKAVVVEDLTRNAATTVEARTPPPNQVPTVDSVKGTDTLAKSTVAEIAPGPKKSTTARNRKTPLALTVMIALLGVAVGWSLLQRRTKEAPISPSPVELRGEGGQETRASSEQSAALAPSLSKGVAAAPATKKDKTTSKGTTSLSGERGVSDAALPAVTSAPPSSPPRVASPPSGRVDEFRDMTRQ